MPPTAARLRHQRTALLDRHRTTAGPVEEAYPELPLEAGEAWALQLLLAAAFLGAGLSKLAGVPMMIDLFDRFGVGQWFRYVTGLVEIGGAALLLIPGFARAGATLLGTTMFFAVLTHLKILRDSSVPALVLLVLNLVLLALRRDQVAALRGRLLPRPKRLDQRSLRRQASPLWRRRLRFRQGCGRGSEAAPAPRRRAEHAEARPRGGWARHLHRFLTASRDGPTFGA